MRKHAIFLDPDYTKITGEREIAQEDISNEIMTTLYFGNMMKAPANENSIHASDISKELFLEMELGKNAPRPEITQKSPRNVYDVTTFNGGSKL